MRRDTKKYNEAQTPGERAICELLAREIDRNLPEAENAGERPDLADEVIVPDVLIQPHSSTLELVFYDADAFPAEYRGDAFATLHGSWNREERTGYKVIRAMMNGGEATGEYEDFMTGFVLDENTVWGRPAGIVVTRDGDLLVTDDANGTIFRVSYSSP